MNRKNFIRSVAEVLRDSGAKKPVSIPKQVFHISDDEGNARDFTVKKTDKTVMYTLNDVSTIVDACIYVIMESLKRGESINFHGFGSLGLNYRKPRRTKMIGSDQEIIIDGRYTPRFSFGDDLRMCAKIYELSLQDQPELPTPRYDESDESEEVVSRGD